MTASEVQRLRAAAERALAAGHHQQALAHSIRLERAAPEDPSAPRYTALVCQAMGRTPDQIDALDRAAERHARRGEALKAAAVCKHILALDPGHAATRHRLARLRAAIPRPPASDPRRGATSARPDPARPSPRIESGVFGRDQGAGLQGLPLREVVPGGDRRVRSGVWAIPLGDDPEHSLGKVLAPEETADLPSGAAVPRVVPAALPAAGAPALAAEDVAVAEVAEALRTAQRTEQALTDTPLFRDMPEDAFHDLIDRARLIRVARDETVFRQGAPGDALYVIAEGEVGVIDEGPPRRGICKLGEGDFFGEMALVSDAPRSATCTALTDAELIAIDRPVLQAVLRAHPEVLSVLLRFFRDRSIDRVLQVSPIFAQLGARDREAVRPYFRFLEVVPGARLIEEGARPEGLFVLLTGRAEAIRAGEGGGHERIGLLFPGDVAGEMSIVRDQPANATVRAIDKVFAVELPAPVLRRILDARPRIRAYVEKLARTRAPSFAPRSGPR